MTVLVTPSHITLLVEDLGKMVGAVSGEGRFLSLERIFSRGRACRVDSITPNHLRFALFGIEPGGFLPVAALTHVCDRESKPQDEYYWLLTDPVTMWADMAQVFMTSHGFADLDPIERNEIENTIRAVLLEEGIDLHSDHPERWCIALGEPLDFEFTPLDEALGMDVADALPDHPEARYWRRILNEIQVALHQCPVNVRRRQLGKQEINSVWFWGGGFIPDAAPHDLIDTVYSTHPVTRGLAIINDCSMRTGDEAMASDFRRDGRTVLVDWSPSSGDPAEELNLIEDLVSRLLKRVHQGHGTLSVFDGSGDGRIYDRSASRRFWKRRSPLSRGLASPARA